MQTKVVLCSTVIVDILGPQDTKLKQINIAERLVAKALQPLARKLKADRISQLKGFRLRLGK